MNIEQEIQSKGLVAPRVTPADIEANIANEHYFTAKDGVFGSAEYRHGVGAGDRAHEAIQGDAHRTLGLLTFCVLVLRNGFTVTGESACASPENFDADLGRKIARQNAVSKVWPLMGYSLRERLHRLSFAPEGYQDRVREERSDLRSKFAKLSVFIDSPEYRALPQVEREALSRQYTAMSAYLNAIDDRISRFEA